MKTIFLMLMISLSAIAQTENFSIEKNTLTWKEIKNLDDNYFLQLENNFKLEITKNGDSTIRGYAKNLKCKCSGTSLFMKEEFDAEFIATKVNNEIHLSVFNLRFKNTNEFSFYDTNTKSDLPAEEHFLIKGRLKQSKTMQKNLGCLNQLFLEIFE